MLFLIRALARLSLCTLHRLGVCLGWLAYGVSGNYRQRLDQHARLAGLTKAQRRGAVASAGQMVAELPRMWLRPADEPLGPLVMWQGAELIDAALKAGRGTVLLTPHLGCFEITAQAFAERFGGQTRLTVMYRPARQAWLRELEESTRVRPGLATTPAALSGVRQMIRALRRGDSVGLLPDQVPPTGMGVWAPFFGQPAYTMTLATRLVQQTGAALLLIWAERLPSGQGYVLRVSEPVAAMPEKLPDEEAWQIACAAALNREMERLIMQCPQQYLWGYHRYKQPRPADAGQATDSAASGVRR